MIAATRHRHTACGNWVRHWLLAGVVLVSGGCFASRGAGLPRSDAAPSRWRDLVGCYQLEDGQFALDSVPNEKLAGRPGGRLARFAPLPAVVGGYWFVTGRGMLRVVRHDGPWGRTHEFAVRGDSLIGRAFVRTGVPHARDKPAPPLALRTLTCRVGPRADPRTSPPRAAAGLPADRPRPYTIDDRFAALAAAVPGGFGGLWLEGTVLHVNLVDLSKREEARSALRAELQGEFGPGAPSRQRASVDLDRIVFHQGRYDYLQLTGWYARLPAALGYESVTSTDIDERRNRIRIGVRDDAAAERVGRRIRELRIPPDAVLVQREEPGVGAVSGRPARGFAPP